MNRIQRVSWWYWLANGVLLAAGLSGCPLGMAPAIGLAAVQVLHFGVRERSPRAFPVQVRIGYLVWMLAGLWSPLAFFHWIQLAGTAMAVLLDYCPMARMLSLLPWNRRRPLTWRLVASTFIQPPVRGSILSAT